MTYSNLPVYVGQKNSDTITESGSPLVATDVSIDYPTRMAPKRLLGQEIKSDEQVTFDGASEVGISVNFLVHTNLPASSENSYAFLLDHHLASATGSNFFPIKVGDNLFEKCFLDSYSASIQPFAPVQFSAKFTSYDPARLHKISGDNSLPDSNLEDLLDSDKVVYGHTVGFQNTSQVVDENVLSSVSFTKNYSRTPVYRLGDIVASKYLVDSVESEMRIESTGLNKLIDHSGTKLTSDIKFTLTDHAGAGINPFGGALGGAGLLSIVANSGSNLTAENYGMQGGESLVANVTIKDVIV